MTRTIKKRGKSAILIRTAAKKLFWKYGIKKVSVAEVCTEAGISKMTFYRNFENKSELANQVLTQELELGREQYNSIMAPDIPFAEKIRHMIDQKHRSTQDISQEFIKDIYQLKDEKLANQLEVHRAYMMKLLKKDLGKAQKKGEIRKNMNLDFIIYMLNSIHEKVLDKNLVAMYGTSQDLIMELTNFCFYGLLNPEKQ